MQYQRDQKAKAVGVDSMDQGYNKRDEDLGSLEQLEKRTWGRGNVHDLNSLETHNQFGLFQHYENDFPPCLAKEQVDEEMLVEYLMEFKQHEVQDYAKEQRIDIVQAAQEIGDNRDVWAS